MTTHTSPSTTSATATCLAQHEQTLSPSELGEARQYLDRTRAALIDATAGVTPAQWSFKTAADRWSILEILEHVVIVQERVLGPITQELATTPRATSPNAKQVDAFILSQFPDRTLRFQAPEFVHPTGRCTREELLDRLTRNYDSFARRLETTLGLREHLIESMPLKALSNGTYTYMDGYQWILAAATHTERHTNQIVEVKADPSFPTA